MKVFKPDLTESRWPQSMQRIYITPLVHVHRTVGTPILRAYWDCSQCTRKRASPRGESTVHNEIMRSDETCGVTEQEHGWSHHLFDFG